MINTKIKHPVLNISKIQSESKSQRINMGAVNGSACAQYIKDTI